MANTQETALEVGDNSRMEPKQPLVSLLGQGDPQAMNLAMWSEAPIMKRPTTTSASLNHGLISQAGGLSIYLPRLWPGVAP
ncbi:hypothetical protein IB75_03050 [Nitrosococcus oceani C-27]|uniref:Uncharacterized protein n=1 Tax=Nitrosococcus oceani C-27 TaxID=314279 RepID=A0A0E2Z9Q1_9GAMM|nr:hypothetical protein IB75_03050 [Nitrosococcus oceani C-27]